MTEWILVVLFISYTGITSTSVPGFKNFNECTTVGKSVGENFPTFTIKYTCVQQTKK